MHTLKVHIVLMACIIALSLLLPQASIAQVNESQQYIITHREVEVIDTAAVQAKIMAKKIEKRKALTEAQNALNQYVEKQIQVKKAESEKINELLEDVNDILNTLDIIYDKNLRCARKIQTKTQKECLAKMVPSLLEINEIKQCYATHKEIEKVIKYASKGKISDEIHWTLSNGWYYFSGLQSDLGNENRKIEKDILALRSINNSRSDYWGDDDNIKTSIKTISEIQSYLSSLEKSNLLEAYYLSIGTRSHSYPKKTIVISEYSYNPNYRPLQYDEEIDMELQTKGWEWASDKYRLSKKSESYPNQFTYYFSESHPGIKIKDDGGMMAAYDNDGKLLRVLKIDRRDRAIKEREEGYWGYYIKNAYKNNKYNILSEPKEVQLSIKLKLGLEKDNDPTPNHDKRLEKINRQYMSTSNKKTKKKLLGQGFNTLIEGIAANEAKTKRWNNPTALRWIEQIKQDYREDLGMLWKIERTDDVSFKVYYLNKNQDTVTIFPISFVIDKPFGDLNVSPKGTFSQSPLSEVYK